MGPDCPLPLPPKYTDPEVYLDDLINFCSSSKLWDQLCGGVHILDFFTRQEDLYAWLLPSEWRDWFEIHDLEDILDFLMREDLAAFGSKAANGSKQSASSTWRGHSPPPDSLLEYVRGVRDLLLDRTFKPSSGTATPALPRHVSVGMKVKKVHEVALFSQYVTSLCADIARDSSSEENITHLVDFGSGQNYLGRTLASEPFNKHVIAVESKKSNIEGSRRMDVHAKLAPQVKKTRMVNKKEWNRQFKTSKQERLRRRMEENGNDEDHNLNGTDSTKLQNVETSEIAPGIVKSTSGPDEHVSSNATVPDVQDEDHEVLLHAENETDLPNNMLSSDCGLETEGRTRQDTSPPAGSIEVPSTNGTPHTEVVEGKGSVQYVEHRLEDGNLAAVLEDISGFRQVPQGDSNHLNSKTNSEENTDILHTNGASVADSPPSLLVMVSQSNHLHTIFRYTPWLTNNPVYPLLWQPLAPRP